jgi:uncharacterized protein
MKLNIQNLKQGITEVRETVAPDFLPEELKHFYPDPFDVRALIDRFDRDIRIKIEFATTAHYRCDRCLAEFDGTLEGEYEQIYTLGGETDPEETEIIGLSQDIKEIDVSPLIAESVLLNHPIKMLCEAGCKGICPKCGADLNKNECTCSDDETDPRWDELKKLIR